MINLCWQLADLSSRLGGLVTRRDHRLMMTAIAGAADMPSGLALDGEIARCVHAYQEVSAARHAVSQINAVAMQRRKRSVSPWCGICLTDPAASFDADAELKKEG